MVKDVRFTGCQSPPAGEQAGALNAVSAVLHVFEQGALNGGKQAVEIDRLNQEVDRSTCHRAHHRHRVALRCHKDDGRSSAAGQPGLDLKTIDVWKDQIEDKTSGSVISAGRHVLGSGSEAGYTDSV